MIFDYSSISQLKSIGNVLGPRSYFLRPVVDRQHGLAPFGPFEAAYRCASWSVREMVAVLREPKDLELPEAVLRFAKVFGPHLPPTQAIMPCSYFRKTRTGRAAARIGNRHSLGQLIVIDVSSPWG